MAENVPAFEEIDRRVSALDLKAFQRGGRQYFSHEEVIAAPGDVLQKVCAIDRGIRPF